MKKIGIVTLHGYGNYGNRLQNIAIASFVKLKGYYPVNIVRHKDTYSLKDKVHFFLKRNDLDVKRETEIRKEAKKAVKELSSNKMSKCKKFIFGSDQIWNYSFLKNDVDYYLGSEIIKKNDVLFYAASMSCETIPYEYSIKFKNNLVQPPSQIYVRERKTIELLKKIGIESNYINDPVFLFDSREWTNILSLKNENTGNYYLCYFLTKNKSKINELEKKANSEKCILIDLLDKNSPHYCSNLSKFINLIANAKKIFTDSFHASAFSIIFKRDFFVFEREDGNKGMNERIYSLLKEFDLEDRFISSLENIETITSKASDSKLESVKKQSRSVLEKFLAQNNFLTKE